MFYRSEGYRENFNDESCLIKTNTNQWFLGEKQDETEK